MDFELTDEQKMVVDSVDKLLSDQYDFQSRCKRLSSNDALIFLFGSILRMGLGYAIANRYGGFSARLVIYRRLWSRWVRLW